MFLTTLMLNYHWKGWRLLAILWWIFISILFFVPGSELPHETWLDKIYADKLIHIGFFGLLSFLWRFYFPPGRSNARFILIVAALVYAIIVELIQGAWVPNRSSEILDVVADMTGAACGLLFWSIVYKKNKPL